MPLRSRSEFDKQFRYITAAGGKPASARGIRGIVAQQLSVFLDIRSATGGVDRHVIQALALEDVDETSRGLPCLLFPARVRHQRAAASLIARDDHLASF